MTRFFSASNLRRTGTGAAAQRRRRFNIEALEDRFALSVTGTAILPVFTLTEATTKDAASVTVDYSIAKSDIRQPLAFDVYRSDKPALDSASALVGETTLDPSVDSGLLTQGNHTGVTLLPGTVLTPNTSLPYLVVVADGNGAVSEDPSSVNTTYFHTYVLGVVVHGLEFSASGATPTWETSMADDLVSINHYDSVIAFNWVKDSEKPAPGMATKAGDALYSQVASSAAALDQSHVGDVVDLQFIGHSRGAVVVSRALQDLASQPVTALTGSYVDVTLLDPHPSNPANDGMVSVKKDLLGSIAMVGYRAFEASTKDPPVDLPANAGIRAIDIYYEHTPASAFPSNNIESLINLWGEGPDDGLLINQSGVSIQWHNLTSVIDPTIGPIGHTETHAWYELHVVDTGSTFADASTVLRPNVSNAASSAALTLALPSNAPQIVSNTPLSNWRTVPRVSRPVVTRL